MNREDEKKSSGADQSNVQQTTDAPPSRQQKEDEDQHSYPGKLDQVEGNMNNGEIGGGLSKENDS